MHYKAKYLHIYMKDFVRCVNKNRSILGLHGDNFSVEEAKEILLMYASCGHKQIWKVEPQLLHLLENQHRHIRLFAMDLLKVLARSSHTTTASQKRCHMKQIANSLLQNEKICSLNNKEVSAIVKQHMQTQANEGEKEQAFSFCHPKPQEYFKANDKDLFPILQILAKQHKPEFAKQQTIEQKPTSYPKIEKALKNQHYDLAIMLLNKQILINNPEDVKAQRLLIGTINRKYKEEGYPGKLRNTTQKAILLIQIRLARITKNWREVISLANDYLTYNPQNIRILHILGNAFVKSDYLPSAIFIFELILTLDPRNIRALLALTKIHKDMKEYDKAIFYCQKAVKLKPSDDEIAKEVKRIAAIKTTDVYTESKYSRDLIKDKDEANRLERLGQISQKKDAAPVRKPQPKQKLKPQLQLQTPEPIEKAVKRKKKKISTKEPIVPASQITVSEEETVKIVSRKRQAPEEFRKQEIIAKIPKVDREELPAFEKFLSEDAGRPGPMERIIAQSVNLMKFLQYTLGLKCIVIVNAVDLTVDAISSYITGIFRTWKMSKSIHRNLQRNVNNSHAAELTLELQKNRARLSRLFMLHGYDPHLYNEQLRPSFAVKLIIESRGHLDEMKQDLAFLTTKQTTQTIRNSFKDTIMSFIPNPFSIFTTWKDLAILSLWMKYNRRQIEQMYADFIVCYCQTIRILNQEQQNSSASVLLKYEENLLKRLGFTLEEQGDIEYWIERCRVALQRITQMLINPGKFIDCSYWPKADLLSEIKKGNQNPQYVLQLEWWLNKQVGKHLSKQTTTKELYLRLEEAYSLRRRYKLQKKLSQKFI
ncbi:tetratricopeptide repeat protein [Candidatus Uabimicrobium amorphum]|uniref:Tetratricopeptide repeat protein n=1 Tax=Uabimicrobium amorphum TaxID=2596890 RepID=A0A5S9IMH3_UABAM|nr:hypothetical protein [Candidatus Uabimicrobium amorphum]BBM84589.1 hypothetical protein UABAM_02950 [Candidatus Uabimicrobium amorphum]